MVWSQRFAADFEQHCSDRHSGPRRCHTVQLDHQSRTLRLEVPIPRIRSRSRPQVMDASRPRPGLRGWPDAVFADVAVGCHSFALQATADSGYTFMGWTEDCSGPASTTLKVNGPKRCGASFEPTAVPPPRAWLRWDHQVGAAPLVSAARCSPWRTASFRPPPFGTATAWPSGSIASGRRLARPGRSNSAPLWGSSSRLVDTSPRAQGRFRVRECRRSHCLGTELAALVVSSRFARLPWVCRTRS